MFDQLDERGDRRDRPSGLSGPERCRPDPGRRDRPSGLSGPQRPGLGPERRSSPRLRAFDYRGPFAYSITINTAAGHRVFADRSAVYECTEALREACAQHGFTLSAYCFMPNHLHMLIEGSENSSLVRFVKQFKQLSSYRYKRRTGRSLWQRSYYDHVLRCEEDLSTAAEYIWDNPVRAGLVEERSAYPFSGPTQAMGPDRPEGLSLRSPLSMGAARA